MMRNRISLSIALALLMLGTSAGLKYMEHLGLLEPETVRRLVQVMIGLMLAGYANVMPKNPGAWSASPVVVARAQSALRVGGWSLTLAGLLHAGLWAFAPTDVANTASVVVVATAMVVTIGFAGWTLLACRSGKSQAS